MIHQLNCLTRTNRTKTRYQEEPKYAEGLYELGGNCYAWMVPNGSWGEANAGLVVGNGESLLIDTLWDVEHTREMLDAMEPLIKNAPIKTVVNTHADGDHFWGNQLVKNADIITSKASYDEMKTTQPKSMLMLDRVGQVLHWLGRIPGLRSQAQVGHWFRGMVKPYNFAGVTHTLPNRTFSGEMKLTVGGREIQLIEVGPAHTRGDAMVYIPDAKILFTADVMFVESTPVMWAGPLENWLKALDRILSIDADIIIPGHGSCTDKEGVRQVKAYWEFVDREVRRRYEQGFTAQEAATDIALSGDFAAQPFAQWNSPERIMVSTHTLYRHLQGRKDHPRVPELLNMLRKQAVLAHLLPEAQPAAMRLR